MFETILEALQIVTTFDLKTKAGSASTEADMARENWECYFRYFHQHCLIHYLIRYLIHYLIRYLIRYLIHYLIRYRLGYYLTLI